MRFFNFSNKTIGTMVVAILMISGGALTLGVTTLVSAQQANQRPTCEDSLRTTNAMVEISQDGRARAEQALAETFVKLQDAKKEIAALKAKSATPAEANQEEGK